MDFPAYLLPGMLSGMGWGFIDDVTDWVDDNVVDPVEDAGNWLDDNVWDPVNENVFEPTWDFFNEDIFTADEMREQAEDLAAEERARQQSHEDQVRTGVSNLRELYGYGDSPTASANRRRLNQLIDRSARAVAETQGAQVDQAYADAQTTSKAAFARSGNAGGGADRSQSRRNTAGMVAGHQQVAQNAQGFKQNMRTSMDQQMLMQENAILGAQATPDAYYDPGRLAVMFRSAQQQAPALAMQSMLNAGANMVTVDAQSKGMGRQGVF